MEYFYRFNEFFAIPMIWKYLSRKNSSETGITQFAYLHGFFMNYFGSLLKKKSCFRSIPLELSGK